MRKKMNVNFEFTTVSGSNCHFAVEKIAVFIVVLTDNKEFIILSDVFTKENISHLMLNTVYKLLCKLVR